MGKEKIPLELLDLLKFEENSDLSLLTFRDTDNYFLLIPKELDSVHCFFSVVKKSSTQANGTPIKYEIVFKPAARNNVEPFRGSRDVIQIKALLETWLSFIREFLKSDTIFDDPLIAAYKREFEDKIRIMDPDAELTSFDLEKQIAITQYLSWVEEILEKHKVPDNEKKLIEIQEEIKVLKSEITVLPKQKIIQRLAIIWAKSRKVSLDLIKEIFVEVVSSTISKMITG